MYLAKVLLNISKMRYLIQTRVRISINTC